MSTFVRFQVPVFAEVDDAGNEVLSVRVDDESVIGQPDVHDFAGSSISDDRRRRALAVVDGADWPAWEFGH